MVERRRWPLAEKLRIVEEASRPGMSVSYVAHKYATAPNLLSRWRKLMSESGKVAVQADDEVVIEDWRRTYNEVRPHSSLGKMTPSSYVRMIGNTSTQGVTLKNWVV